MKRRALASSLLLKFDDHAISLLSNIDKIKPKTSVVANLLAKIADHPKQKVLILADKKYPNLYLALRNLQKVEIKRATLVNAYDIISSDKIIPSQKALDVLKTRLKTN